MKMPWRHFVTKGPISLTNATKIKTKTTPIRCFSPCPNPKFLSINQKKCIHSYNLMKI